MKLIFMDNSLLSDSKKNENSQKADTETLHMKVSVVCSGLQITLSIFLCLFISNYK